MKLLFYSWPIYSTRETARFNRKSLKCSCYFILDLFIVPLKQSPFSDGHIVPYCSLMFLAVVTDLDTRPRYGWLTSRCTALCGGSQWPQWDKPPHSLAQCCIKKQIKKDSVLCGVRDLFSVTSLSGIQSMQELSVPKWLSLVTSVSWSGFHPCAVRAPL